MNNIDIQDIVKLAERVQGRYAYPYLTGMMSAHLCDCALQSIKESLLEEIARKEANNV